MANRLTEAQIAEIRKRADAAPCEAWEEEWRALTWINPHYEVSDFGNVRSHLKPGNHKNKLGLPRLLKPVPNQAGYLSVSLPNAATGGYSHQRIHTLVARAFHGERPDGTEVCHLNGVRTDNRATNLAYASHRENERHKKLHGTDGVGERNSISKLLGWQVAEIKYLAGRGVPQAKIAVLFDLTRHDISEVVNGDRWATEPSRSDIPALLAHIEAVEAELAKVDAALIEKESAERLALARRIASERCRAEKAEAEVTRLRAESAAASTAARAEAWATCGVTGVEHRWHEMYNGYGERNPDAEWCVDCQVDRSAIAPVAGGEGGAG